MTVAVPAPAFIVGCGRSGTTLLRAMLDSHPDIAVPPESYFVVALLKQRYAFETGDALDGDALLAEMGRAASFRDWDLPVDEVAGWPAFATAGTVPEALAAAYQCYAARSGKQMAVDKTPFQGPNIGLLARSFAGARFIHLVRDGRNVAQSLATMHFGPTSLGGGILEWRRHVDAIDTYTSENPSEVLTVRYEDLVDDAPDRLSSICDHLGLTFDPAMLAYTERADHVLAGMSRTEHLEGVRRPPSRDPRSWRDDLDPGTVAVLELLAAPTLDRHGYTPSPPTRSFTCRRRAATALVRYRIRSARLGLAARRARLIRARRVGRVRRLSPGASPP